MTCPTCWTVGEIVRELRGLRLTPVLVGGMALVVWGRTKVRSHVFDIASEADLMRLKQIAKAARSAPGDAEDIAFLEARRRRRAAGGSRGRSRCH